MTIYYTYEYTIYMYIHTYIEHMYTVYFIQIASMLFIKNL